MNLSLSLSLRRFVVSALLGILVLALSVPTHAFAPSELPRNSGATEPSVSRSDEPTVAGLSGPEEAYEWDKGTLRLQPGVKAKVSKQDWAVLQQVVSSLNQGMELDLITIDKKLKVTVTEAGVRSYTDDLTRMSAGYLEATNVTGSWLGVVLEVSDSCGDASRADAVVSQTSGAVSQLSSHACWVFALGATFSSANLFLLIYNPGPGLLYWITAGIVALGTEIQVVVSGVDCNVRSAKVQNRNSFGHYKICTLTYAWGTTKKYRC